MPSISIALTRSTNAPGKVFSIPNRTPIFFTESSIRFLVEVWAARIIVVGCPAGRASCAEGGHFVTCIPVLVWDVLGSSRWSGQGLALEIGCEHSLPPGPVVACVVAPYVETARDTFVAKDLCHAFIFVPALIVDTGCEDVGVATVAVEIPGVADVGEVVHGDVEV